MRLVPDSPVATSEPVTVISSLLKNASTCVYMFEQSAVWSNSVRFFPYLIDVRGVVTPLFSLRTAEKLL